MPFRDVYTVVYTCGRFEARNAGFRVGARIAYSHAMYKRAISVMVLFLCGFVDYLLLRPTLQHPAIDFTQFYFASRIVAGGQIARIHDRAVYEPLVAEVKKDFYWKDHPYYYNRPAFSAVFYWPLSWFSYVTASRVHLAINLLLMALLIWKLPIWLNANPSVRFGLWLYFPFAYSVGMGQDTLLITLIMAYSLCVLIHRNQTLAGVLLSLCLFKPHLLVLVPLLFLAERKREALRAFLLSGAALAAISVAIVGPAGVRQFIDLLQAPTTDYYPSYMGNIRAVSMNFGPEFAWFVGIFAVGTAILVFYREGYYERLTVCLMLPLLLGPHVYWCDYCLLAIVALITRNRMARWMILIPWPYFPLSNATWPMVLCGTAVLILMAWDALWYRKPEPVADLPRPTFDAIPAESSY
jgi:hypothetical protein